MPWRLRIAGSFFRGLVRDPAQALRRAPQIGIEMKSLYRFNLHIHGKDFLRAFAAESEKLGLRPFLLWGTLLGCVREGGFIEHDYDLDYGILPGGWARKDGLIAAMERRGYRLRLDRPYLFSFERPDGLLHLDINLVYPFEGRMVCSVAEDDGGISAHAFPPDVFRDLKRIPFLKDLSVWLPGDPEAVLEAIYGDWRSPVKDYNYKGGPRNRVLDAGTLSRLRNFSPPAGD